MASSPIESTLFSSLPRWRAPWYEFVLSYGVQAVVIAILVWIPVLHPDILERPKKDLQLIALVPTPPPVNRTPQPQLTKPLQLARLDPPPATLRLPASQPKPKAEDVPEVAVKMASKIEPVPIPTPAIPRQIVRTNVFSTGSSAPQTVERPPQQVQTGGFGDPNGIPVKNSQTRAVNIAVAGGFDMPAGPGNGNGTAGANGPRGVVASTGFGGGPATGDARTSSPPRAAVKSAGFGDADVPAPPTVQSRPAGQTAAKIVPAEILSKPLPIYTEEARSKRIEGEVLLQVVLEASGRLRVLKIVHGLGHGLDDAAVHAAEQIRFKPALQDGQPSDSTVVLHIIFQLA
jgi:TonB family protein